MAKGWAKKKVGMREGERGNKEEKKKESLNIILNRGGNKFQPFPKKDYGGWSLCTWKKRYFLKAGPRGKGLWGRKEKSKKIQKLPSGGGGKTVLTGGKGIH